MKGVGIYTVVVITDHDDDNNDNDYYKNRIVYPFQTSFWLLKVSRRDASITILLHYLFLSCFPFVLALLTDISRWSFNMGSRNHSANWNPALTRGVFRPSELKP